MKRWIAAGAILGLVVALALTSAMPVRQLHTVYIPEPHGRRVAVYGALAPYAPARFNAVAEERSPRTLRDALLGLLAGGLAVSALLSVGRGRSERGD